MKLNLGCGNMFIPEFINCDKYNKKADVVCDVKILPFNSNSIEEIYASHLIEHFDFKEAFEVLKEWKRVLKEGGLLVIETPDLLGTCKAFVEGTDTRKVDLYGHFFATPWIEGQIHKFLYTEKQLEWTLKELGFKNIKKTPALRYIGCEDINLRMECIK